MRNGKWSTILATMLTVVMVMSNSGIAMAAETFATISSEGSTVQTVTSDEQEGSEVETASQVDAELIEKDKATAEEAGSFDTENSSEKEEKAVEEEIPEVTAEAASEEAATADDETAAVASTEAAVTDSTETAAQLDTFEETTYSYEDSKVKVTAVLTDPAAVPDSAELVVTPVTKDTEGYNYDAYMEALNNAAAEGESYGESNTLLYDVAFMMTVTDADGNGKVVEYEPTAGSVKISVEFKQSQLSDDLQVEKAGSVEVKHLPLTDAARNDADSTKEATDISASDVVIEDVSASASIGGSESVTFSVSDLSVISITDADKLAQNTYSTDKINYETVLGDAIEYGLVADKYETTVHTETNFAVKTYNNHDQIVEVDLSNSDADIPFVIGSIEGSLRFGIKTDSENIDVELQPGQESRVHTDNQNEVINFITKSQDELNAKVDQIRSDAMSNSAMLAALPTTAIVSKDSSDIGVFVNDKTIDTTRLPDNVTIVINAGDIMPVGNASFWQNEPVIKKLENQNIVFNVDDKYVDNSNGQVTTLRNFKVQVGGKEIASTQDNSGNDTDHNKDVDNYILRHIIWNVTTSKVKSIQNSSGLFLVSSSAPITEIQNAGGWLVSNSDLSFSGEWHFVFHGRKYKAAGKIDLGGHKTLENKDLAAGDFDFTLTELVEENSALHKTGDVLQTKSNDGEGNFTFDELDFTQDDLVYPDGVQKGNKGSGTKYYVIEEKVPKGATKKADGSYVYNGIAYDPEVFIVKAQLSDSGDGNIKSALSVHSAT